MKRLRDDSVRLEAASYPLRFEMRTSFCDMDVYGHINNVAEMRFFEEARATLNLRAFGPLVFTDASKTQSKLVVASQHVEYLNEGAYPGDVTVCVGFSRVGRSSFNQSSALFQEDRCLALCESVMVHTVQGRPTEIPPAFLAKMLEQRIPLLA